MPVLMAAVPPHERPRERLLEHGAEALTDSELLALVLRNGARGVSAVVLGCAQATRSSLESSDKIYTGRTPCLRHGRSTCLLRAISRPRVIVSLVSAGSIRSSMKDHPAAT